MEVGARLVTPQATIIELSGVVCGSMPRTKNPSGGAEHAESGNLDVPRINVVPAEVYNQVQPVLLSIYFRLETRLNKKMIVYEQLCMPSVCMYVVADRQMLYYNR